MKTTVVLFLACFFTALANNSFSQETRLSIRLKSVSIENIFNEIERTSDYIFMLPTDIDKELKQSISIDINNQDINTIMRKVLVQVSNLSYRVMGRQVIVYRNDENVNVQQQQPVSKPNVLKGKVIDPKNEPVIGVSIRIKSTSHGTASDSNGNYELILPADSRNIIIQFSYIGMKSKEVRYNGSERLDIRMEEDNMEINELVVMGYQSLDKRDIVGSVITLKAKDIITPDQTSIDQMLQGRIPGLVATNISSRVGTSPKITIRGTSTILGNQDPLWVVDGVIQPDPLRIDVNTAMTDDLRNIIGNQISWLNPRDIEDITVLKDASATAIYGSKASNGVIIITTKKSTSDKINISYNTSFSFRQQPTYKDFNLMNSAERIRYSNDAFLAGARYNRVPVEQPYTYEGLALMYMDRKISKDELDSGISKLQDVNTNWFDLLTRNSLSQQHYLTVSGRNEKASYNVSIGYSDSKGIEIGNDSKRFTGRARVFVNLSAKVNIDFSLSGQQSGNKGYGPRVNPLSYATRTSRALPAFTDDNEYLFYKKESGYELVAPRPILGYNILNEMNHSGAASESSMWNANLSLKWNITPTLRYEFVAGIGNRNSAAHSYAGEQTFYIADKYRGYDFGTVIPASPRYKAALLPFGGELFTSSMNTSSLNLQNTLTYYTVFDNKHRINVLAGTEMRSDNEKSLSNTVWGYVDERGEKIMRPAVPKEIVPIGKDYNPFTTLGIFKELYDGGWNKHSQVNNFLSFFATAAYSYRNKYVFNFNVRSDASNRFGQNVNQQFDPTYSFGISWRGAEEEWFKKIFNEHVNQLNLRASYGIQGNALTNISPDMIARMGEILRTYNEYSSKINSLPNPNLNWERTESWNLGLDLQLFNNVYMALEYYKRTSNAIIDQNIPHEYGVRSMYENGGIINNHGIEYSVNFNIVNTEKFAWAIGINSSKNWNAANNDPTSRITRFKLLSGSDNEILKKGYPTSSFWSYSFKGLNPQTGYPEFNLMDVDRETAKSDASTYLEYSGQRYPDFTGGLSTRIRYRTFTIGANFSLLMGGKKRLPELFTNAAFIADPERNVSRDFLNVWKKTGDELTTNVPALFTGGSQYIILQDGTLESMYSMWNNSTYRVVNASFLRCNQLSITWDLSEIARKISLKSALLSAGVSNVFVIADKRFQGFDPELGNSVMPRIYSLSFNVGF